MLIREQVEVGRPRPAEPALVGPSTPPLTTGFEVIRAFPSVLGSEHRSLVLHALMKRAGPAWTAPLVGVVWIAEVVVVPVCLACQLGGITVVAVNRTKAPGPVGM